MDFVNCIRVNDCLMNMKKNECDELRKNKINLRIFIDILMLV